MGTRTFSEADSARLIARLGIPTAPFQRARTPGEAAAAADELGYPVVVKLNGERIAHKSERDLVRLRVTTHDDVRVAAEQLLGTARPDDGDVDVVVSRMVHGSRELLAGVHTDPQFGPCVVLGVGGVLTEAVDDVVVRLVPLTRVDAEDMIDELRTQRLLGEFRGEPAVDRDALVEIVLALAQLVESESNVVSVDVNPLIVHEGMPIAVDALVEVST